MLSIPRVLNQGLRNALRSIIESYQSKDEKNQSNGYIGANSSGKLNPNQISLDSSNRFVSDTEKSTWNGKQNDLGFTPENTANKNLPNGYLGFQKDVYVIHINFLQSNLVYSSPYLYNATTNSGAGSYTSTGSTNTPKLKSGNDTQFRLPTMNLVGSATGAVTCALNGMGAMTLKSPFKLISEQVFSYTDLGSKNNSFVIGIGDGSRNLSSFSGTLLFFILNPLQNSGKWRVGKVISSGTPAYVNTDIVPTYNNTTKFSIYYNKATETALFYIDDILVHTMTSVNLPDNTNITNKASLVRDDNTETIATYATPIQQTLIFDLR